MIIINSMNGMDFAGNGGQDTKRLSRAQGT